METLRIPVPEKGILLKNVTELEDKAWMLTHRQFTHPLLPDQMGAPDYYAYRQLRSSWQISDDASLNLGIWDVASFEKYAFIGYATLKPWRNDPKTGEIGCQIASVYQNRGYASIALTALIRFGKTELNYQNFIADILSGNAKSRRLFEKLGFDLIEELGGHSIYMYTPTDDPSSKKSNSE